MKEETKRLIVGISTLISTCLVLMFVTVFITNRMNITHPLAGSTSAMLTLLGSPVAFVVTAFSAWVAIKLEIKPWIKGCLIAANVLGAIVSAIYCAGLIALWKTGPINPG